MAEWRVVNEPVRPRILVMLFETDADRFAFLEDREGTVKRIESIRDVDPIEWDAIVTDKPLAQHMSTGGSPYGWWTRQIPLGLHVFLVHREGISSGIDLVVGAPDDADPSLAIKGVAGVPGNAARRVEGLGSDIQRLTQQVLVPAVTAREFQWGHQPIDIKGDGSFVADRYQPFLIGPATTVIAGHYTRAPKESVWLIPSDVPDFEPWWDLAMAEWHELTPERIPGIPKWQQAREWMSGSEDFIDQELSGEREAFAEVESQHRQAVGELEGKLAEARARADAYERKLLTSQGDDLQDATLRALTEIGFQVENMDDLWDARERREDYRIRDPEEPDWIVIADATGVSGGAPGSKLQALSTYVNKYMLEEKPNAIPGQWLLVNQFIGRDPGTRGEVLRGDDLRLFAAANGLAIDTAALFLLHRAAMGDDALRSPLRSWLRAATGQVRIQDAKAWLQQ